MVCDHWPLVAADLLDIGIDVWNRELMRTRRWEWLRQAIVSRINSPLRGVYREDSEDGQTYRTRPVHSTRLAELYFAEK